MRRVALRRAVGAGGLLLALVAGHMPAPAFALTLGDATTLTFAMVERTRVESSRWAIAVTIGTGGPGGTVVAAGPERRSAQWTRARVEDILLSVLGAHERAASEGGGWPPTPPRLRRG